MKIKLPTWAQAAVASAGILLHATYLALQPQEAQPAQAYQKPAIDPAFPSALPPPKGLAEQVQKMFEKGEYTLLAKSQEHWGRTQCYDPQYKPFLDCPKECPSEPTIQGRILLDGKPFVFATLGDRVESLLEPAVPGSGKFIEKKYDFYLWGEYSAGVKDGRRAGPYQYNHDRQKWEQVPRWWPSRKTK